MLLLLSLSQAFSLRREEGRCSPRDRPKQQKMVILQQHLLLVSASLLLLLFLLLSLSLLQPCRLLQGRYQLDLVVSPKEWSTALLGVLTMVGPVPLLSFLLLLLLLVLVLLLFLLQWLLLGSWPWEQQKPLWLLLPLLLLLLWLALVSWLLLLLESLLSMPSLREWPRPTLFVAWLLTAQERRDVECRKSVAAKISRMASTSESTSAWPMLGVSP
mmetsp:Transcript_6990/g.15256  ORF Transcript_6990/g.15256 Transcript_6990/m.15256 type:complete len:215 (+) Transcript_6990:1210-1854(+)